MQNYVGKGDKITITAAASGLSGAVVVLEDRAAIAEHDYAVGDNLTLLLEGLVNLAKGAEAFLTGEKLYWNAGSSVVTNTASSNKPIGWSANAYASGITSGVVKLGAF